MAEATKTRRKSPNGAAALRNGPVAERVGNLRERAHTDPEGAREEAWEWIAELGRRAVGDRDGALAELQELFVCGQPAEGVNGQTEGILVTWTMHPIADKLIGSGTNAWMPWLGKKFGPEQKRSINRLTGSALAGEAGRWTRPRSPRSDGPRSTSPPMLRRAGSIRPSTCS